MLQPEDFTTEFPESPERNGKRDLLRFSSEISESPL